MELRSTESTERLWERPPSSRFSYAQMSRFPEFESHNPMAGIKKL